MVWACVFILYAFCCRAWAWPFSFVEENDHIYDSPAKEHHPQRPHTFQAPLSIRQPSAVRELFQSTQELGCRFQLSNALLPSNCGEEESLHVVSRIATVCHYSSNARLHLLPPQCSSDPQCTAKMNPEAFGVYSSFALHAESICRELFSEQWRVAIESMVETLANVADDTLHTLKQAHTETVGFLAEQRNAALSLRESVESVFRVQEKHVEATMLGFETATLGFQKQKEELKEVTTAMQALVEVTASVSHVVDVLLHIKQWTLAEVTEFLRFYFLALVGLRALLGVFSFHSQVAYLRNGVLVCLTCAVSLELGGELNPVQVIQLRTVLVYTVPVWVCLMMMPISVPRKRRISFKVHRKVVARFVSQFHDNKVNSKL